MKGNKYARAEQAFRLAMKHAEIADEAIGLLREAHLFVDTSMFDAKLAERIEAFVKKYELPASETVSSAPDHFPNTR